MQVRNILPPALLMLPLSAPALTIDTYDSEVDFLNAAGANAAGAGATLALEEFSALSTDTSYSSPLTSPEVASGVTFSAPNGFYAVEGQGGAGDPALTTNDFPDYSDVIRADFSTTVTGFGSVVFAEDFAGPLGGTIVVTITGASGGSATGQITTSNTDPYGFLGFIARDDTILNVEWQTTTQNAFTGIDDLHFGEAEVAPIPLPAAWLLLLPGLGLLAMRRRPASA